MKRYQPRRLAAIMLVSGLLVSACEVVTGPEERVRGSGALDEERRNVRDFTGIALSTLGRLYVEQGNREELWIEAEDNLLPYLETRVEGGVLKIRTRRGVELDPTRPVRFHLTVRELDRIVLSSGGSVEAPELNADRLSVSVAGSGDLELPELYAFDLEARLTGSGGVYVSGVIDEQDVSLSGSGPYEARYLESAESRVKVNGSGSATVRVREYLDATVTGSGSVRYWGNPTVRKTVTGSGGVTRIGG